MTLRWQRFLLPSVADLLFLVLLISMTYGALAPRLLSDAGTGWHIRNGELMLRSNSITRVDSFSSTMSGRSWFAWEWLFDLMIAEVHHVAGLNGVVFFAALVVATTFALTFRTVLARGGNVPVAVLFISLAMGASAIHLFARPHIFSWLLVVIWFGFLSRWESEPGHPKTRRLLWLPVLMVLWVNLHGGFVSGLLLLGLYLASAFLRYVTTQERGRSAAAARKLRHLFGITLLSFLATFVNPYGYKLHVHIYQYLSNHFLMNHIEEFVSPDFHGVGQQCFAALLVLTIIALAAASEKPRLSELFVLLFAAASGLYASRSLPISSILLALIAAPVLSQALAVGRTNANLASWLRNCLSRCGAFASRMTVTENSPARPSLACLGGDPGALDLPPWRKTGPAPGSRRAFPLKALSSPGRAADLANGHS